jgi:hypothetical protein
MNTSRLFGGALGLAILAAVATAHTNSQIHHGVGLHAALNDGFVIAFAIAAAFAAIGALTAAVGLPKVSLRAARQQPIAAEGA